MAKVQGVRAARGDFFTCLWKPNTGFRLKFAYILHDNIKNQVIHITIHVLTAVSNRPLMALLQKTELGVLAGTAKSFQKCKKIWKPLRAQRARTLPDDFFRDTLLTSVLHLESAFLPSLEMHSYPFKKCTLYFYVL